MESLIGDICNSFNLFFDKVKDGEYKIVVNVDKSFYPISDIDREKGNATTEILDKLSDLYKDKKVLWGKQVAYGLPTSTYLDNKGAIINVIRDCEKGVVVLYWIKPKGES